MTPSTDAGAEHALRNAMNDEIGIAADRRGEVGVAGSGQREVALVDLG